MQILLKELFMKKEILVLKPRRLTTISGSVYVSLPPDWLSSHNLYNQRTVRVSIDSDSRLIIEPYVGDENVE